MYSYHFREWLMFFYFYSIFGWCFESVYVSLRERRPVNRGFFRGPWLPLYGSGAILVLFLTLPFRAQPALVWLVGAVGATALEYATGEAMVRIFKVRYWDYSGQRFQYKGHICLSSSVAWGFLSLLMVYVVHEAAEQVILWLNEEVVSVAVFAVTALMAYDFSSALRRALDLRALLIQAEQLREELEQRREEKKRLMEATATFALAELEKNLQELAGRQERLKERIADHAEHLLLHNPTSRFMTKVVDAAEVRERLHNLKHKFF